MDDTTPPYGPISKVEQLPLREFLDENLTNQFIRPSRPFYQEQGRSPPPRCP
jgi:hypothetical protein